MSSIRNGESKRRINAIDEWDVYVLWGAISKIACSCHGIGTMFSECVAMRKDSMIKENGHSFNSK